MYDFSRYGVKLSVDDHAVALRAENICARDEHTVVSGVVRPLPAAAILGGVGAVPGQEQLLQIDAEASIVLLQCAGVVLAVKDIGEERDCADR